MRTSSLGISSNVRRWASLFTVHRAHQATADCAISPCPCSCSLRVLGSPVDLEAVASADLFDAGGDMGAQFVQAGGVGCLDLEDQLVRGAADRPRSLAQVDDQLTR